ncbi:MAG: SpoIIE family protein phosphatase [candidate division Zixibacteria bacterium]|nr:SpoIIE family protein phosphatase [candidate division Zixibacteria bacterium]
MNESMTTNYTLDKQVLRLQKENDALKFRLENIGRIGGMITSILDVSTILSVLMELAIEVVDGEVGGILVTKNGELVSKISMGLEPTYAKNWDIKNKGNLIEYLYDNQEVACLKDATEELITGSDSISIKSLLAAPVLSKGETIGAVLIANKASGGQFNEDDVQNLEMLVHFTAVAIDNAKHLNLKLENQSMEQELKVGQSVQEALLPSMKLSIPGIIIDASYTPARQVGGDYYDIIIKDDKHFAVVIGDVTNKGVPAALMMSAVRSMIRSEYRSGKDVADVINSVNQLMCEDVERTRDMFVTLFYGHMDLENFEFSFINAGHPPPFLLRKGAKEMEPLKTSGIILGQFPEFNYEAGSRKLNGNDRLVFYTDGAFECFDNDGNMLGLAGFKDTITEFKIEESPIFLEKINLYLQKYMVDKDKIDDTTLLVLDLK